MQMERLDFFLISTFGMSEEKNIKTYHLSSHAILELFGGLLSDVLKVMICRLGKYIKVPSTNFLLSR